MQCPFCHYTDSRVLESRASGAGESIRRRRECLNCKRRFTTYERIEYVPITVIKRDGSRESFDRFKLLRGIVRACEKTGISSVRLEAFVDELESVVQQQTVKEITSSQIGELVLARIHTLSEVAYIRFASVYRQFQGVKDFVETLNQLQSSKLSPSHAHANESDIDCHQENSSLTPDISPLTAL